LNNWSISVYHYKYHDIQFVNYKEPVKKLVKYHFIRVNSGDIQKLHNHLLYEVIE